MNMFTSDHGSSDSNERRDVGRSKLLNQVVGTLKPKGETVYSPGPEQNTASSVVHNTRKNYTVIILTPDSHFALILFLIASFVLKTPQGLPCSPLTGYAYTEETFNDAAGVPLNRVVLKELSINGSVRCLDAGIGIKVSSCPT